MCRKSSSRSGGLLIDEELEAFLRGGAWFMLGIGVVFLALVLALFTSPSDPDNRIVLYLLPGPLLLIGVALWDLWNNRT